MAKCAVELLGFRFGISDLVQVYGSRVSIIKISDLRFLLNVSAARVLLHCVLATCLLVLSWERPYTDLGDFMFLKLT